MFTHPSFKLNTPRAPSLFSKTNDAQDIFQNLSLESIRAARSRALQSEPSGPWMAGIHFAQERSREKLVPCRTKGEEAPLNSSIAHFESEMVRLHEGYRIAAMVGEGHFGKVYRVLGKADGIDRALKVSKTKSSLD